MSPNPLFTRLGYWKFRLAPFLDPFVVSILEERPINNTEEDDS